MFFRFDTQHHFDKALTAAAKHPLHSGLRFARRA